MKTNIKLHPARIYCAWVLGIASFFGLAAATDVSAGSTPATTAIPWSQLGTKAGADYQGDALAVIPTIEGARLRCEFQRLEGEATREALWLTSTVVPPGGTVNDRFRLVAVRSGAALRALRRQWMQRPSDQPPSSNQPPASSCRRSALFPFTSAAWRRQHSDRPRPGRTC